MKKFSYTIYAQVSLIWAAVECYLFQQYILRTFEPKHFNFIKINPWIFNTIKQIGVQKFYKFRLETHNYSSHFQLLQHNVSRSSKDGYPYPQGYGEGVGRF